MGIINFLKDLFTPIEETKEYKAVEKETENVKDRINLLTTGCALELYARNKYGEPLVWYYKRASKAEEIEKIQETLEEYQKLCEETQVCLTPEIEGLKDSLQKAEEELAEIKEGYDKSLKVQRELIYLRWAMAGFGDENHGEEFDIVLNGQEQALKNAKSRIDSLFNP